MLNDSTLLLGDGSIGRIMYFIDIETSEVNAFKDESLGSILCLTAYGNGLVLIGNEPGEILCYHSLSNKIIFKQKFHNK